MKPRYLLSTSFALAAVGACLLVLSCETESAGGGGSLSIHPREVTLKVGESVTLKARGGETYAWAIETTATNTVGRLSVFSGSTTTYTVLATNEEDVIIRVTSSLTTVRADATTTTTSSTNQTPATVSTEASAIAIIHQKYE